MQMIPYWQSEDGRLTLYHGDVVSVLSQMADDSVDVLDADPPYFLSNGGTTCQGGKMVKVDKGTWDKSAGPEAIYEFNKTWLEQVKRLLKPTGSAWVHGTAHNIYTVGYAAQRLGLHQLNEIVWEKPNPPPNLSCRFFTHSSESILWLSKKRRAKHVFNYAAMKAATGKQMKSVWRMSAPTRDERNVAEKYPAQKPVGLLQRMRRASAPADGLVVTPFCGSGTSGVAAKTLGLRWVGIDASIEALEIAKRRLMAPVELVATLEPPLATIDTDYDIDLVRVAVVELLSELSEADRTALIADLQLRVPCRTCGGDGGFNEQALYMCDACDGDSPCLPRC